MQISRAFSLIVYLIIPFIANAQEEQVSLQFVSFPITADPKPIELITGEGKTIEVELPSNSLSPAYKVPKLQSWILGKTVIGKDEKPSFKIYGQINAASAASQLVLVVRKGIADEDGYDLVCFENNASGFSGGKYIFLNATKVDVAGKLGDLKFALKPKKHTLLAPKPSEEKNDRNYLYTTLYYRKGDEATPFYTSTWRFSEKARTMVFLYHEPHNQRIRIHTIRDYLP
jgi:hypothetical protein